MHVWSTISKPPVVVMVGTAMTCKVTSECVGYSRGTPRSQDRCRALLYKHSRPRVCMAQIIKRHDVDSAVKILLKNAGPVFKEQVIKWGAVHAEKRRCAPHALL